MRKTSGFTLIELMIVVAILAIVAAIVFPVFMGDSQPKVNTINGTNTVQSVMTPNGIIQTRCINGYMFVIGGDGSARQVIDEVGRGAPCNTSPSE